jgi:hypothetical protein
VKQVAVLAGVLALTVPAAALAEPAWQPPVRLVQPADVYTGLAYDDPTLAVNARGDAAIGFSLFIGTTPVAEVAWRSAGAPDWSGPVRLAEGSWTSPHIALDNAGNGLALFDKGIVQTSYHSVGTPAWDDAITIGGSSSAYGLATPGFDASGNLIAAWTPHDVQSSSRSVGGMWQQPPLDVSPVTDRIWGSASLGFDPEGDALLAWSYDDPNGMSNVHTSFRRRGTGTWEAPVDVAASRGAPYDYPVLVALDDGGDATVVWSFSRGGGIATAYRPFGGSWQPRQTLSQSGKPAGLIAGPNGRAVVLFTAQDEIFAISRAQSGVPWAPPVQLSDPTRDARGASVTSDGRGNVVATWVEEDRTTGRETLRAALRPGASQRWEPAVEIAGSPNSYFSASAVAMDGNGNAMAVWDPAAVQYRRVIDVVELKRGGPILSQLSIPASGGTGVKTPFSDSPVPWSAPLVAPTTWDFGDGTSASGNQVRHMYTKEGTYTVTVSAAAGDGTSTEARTIVITKPTLASVKRPVIRGVARVGRTVRCDRGTWSGTEPIVYSTNWLRNGSAVAHGERYRVSNADRSALLACRVKATNGPKTAVALSRSVRVR